MAGLASSEGAATSLNLSQMRQQPSAAGIAGLNDKWELDHPTVFLVRHGKTKFNTGNEEDRLKGIKFDLPLTDEGQKQADMDGKVLSNYQIAHIEHSPMERSRQTAETISKATGATSKPNASLDPWDVGFMSGMKRTSAHDLVTHYINRPDHAPRDGERYSDWFDVYGNALASAMARADETLGEAQVIVTHSCGLLAADAIIKGIARPKAHTDPHHAAPGRIMTIEKKNGRWSISEELP